MVRRNQFVNLFLLFFVLFSTFYLFHVVDVNVDHSDVETTEDLGLDGDEGGKIDPGFKILTFFSKNHFKEALQSCKSLFSLNESKSWKRNVLIAYTHPDVSSYQIVEYRRACPHVQIRKFDADKYPVHVGKNLFEYSWKPVLVAEVLREGVEQLFWFDSSTLVSHNVSSFRDLVEKMSDFPCGIRTFEETHHSIFSATNPLMLRRFNVSDKDAKNSEMLGATVFFFKKTPKSTEIIKNWVECAMTRGCMAPPRSQIHCDSSKLQLNQYANCHRFDQALLSILLYQCHPEKDKLLQKSDLISVKRL